MPPKRKQETALINSCNPIDESTLFDKINIIKHFNTENGKFHDKMHFINSYLKSNNLGTNVLYGECRNVAIEKLKIIINTLNMFDEEIVKKQRTVENKILPPTEPGLPIPLIQNPIGDVSKEANEYINQVNTIVENFKGTNNKYLEYFDLLKALALAADRNLNINEELYENFGILFEKSIKDYSQVTYKNGFNRKNHNDLDKMYLSLKNKFKKFIKNEHDYNLERVEEIETVITNRIVLNDFFKGNELQYYITFVINFFVDILHDLTEERLKGTPINSKYDGFKKAQERISYVFFLNLYTDIEEILNKLGYTYKTLSNLFDGYSILDPFWKNVCSFNINSNINEFITQIYVLIEGNKKYALQNQCGSLFISNKVVTTIQNVPWQSIGVYLGVFDGNVFINNLVISDDFIKSNVSWDTFKQLIEAYTYPQYNPNNKKIIYYTTLADKFDGSATNSLLYTFIKSFENKNLKTTFISENVSFMISIKIRNTNQVFVDIPLISFGYVNSNNKSNIQIYRYFGTVADRYNTLQGYLNTISEETSKLAREEKDDEDNEKYTVKAILKNEKFYESVYDVISNKERASNIPNVIFISAAKTLGDLGKTVSLYFAIKNDPKQLVGVLATGDLSFGKISSYFTTNKLKTITIQKPDYGKTGVFRGFEYNQISGIPRSLAAISYFGKRKKTNLKKSILSILKDIKNLLKL